MSPVRTGRGGETRVRWDCPISATEGREKEVSIGSTWKKVKQQNFDAERGGGVGALLHRAASISSPKGEKGRERAFRLYMDRNECKKGLDP